ncbi:hypothetical protein [Roseibium algae]|uniref:GcrA cell cycle regulator n=1 Tax=Roseibium algae TaxID=3123038 RepID=A0ABU8TKX1_9HYPH
MNVMFKPDVSWSTRNAAAKRAAVSALVEQGLSGTQIAERFSRAGHPVSRYAVVSYCQREALVLKRACAFGDDKRKKGRAQTSDLRDRAGLRDWSAMSQAAKVAFVTRQLGQGLSLSAISRMCCKADGSSLSQGTISWFCKRYDIKLLSGPNDDRRVLAAVAARKRAAQASAGQRPAPSRPERKGQLEKAGQTKDERAALAATSFHANGTGLALSDLTTRSCRQPLWGWTGAADPAPEDRLYCGAAQDPDTSHCFCKAHRALNCVPVERPLGAQSGPQAGDE